jgi:hypothetical protein
VLHPTAGFAATESLLVETGPVHNGSDHAAHVNKVERVVVPGPIQVRVVDFELDVGRNPARLDWSDVGTDYLGIRVFVTKVTADWLAIP